MCTGWGIKMSDKASKLDFEHVELKVKDHSAVNSE